MEKEGSAPRLGGGARLRYIRLALPVETMSLREVPLGSYNLVTFPRLHWRDVNNVRAFSHLLVF